MLADRQCVAVSAFIFTQDHDFLIVQRAAHDSHANRWELPGGALELGEEPHQGIIREVQEETGLMINPRYPLVISDGRSTRIPSLQIVRITFLCALSSKKDLSITLSEGHSAFHWLKLTALPEELTFTEYMYEIYPKLQNHPLLTS